jgi:hypothetical protein
MQHDRILLYLGGIADAESYRVCPASIEVHFSDEVSVFFDRDSRETAIMAPAGMSIDRAERVSTIVGRAVGVARMLEVMTDSDTPRPEIVFRRDAGHGWYGWPLEYVVGCLDLISSCSYFDKEAGIVWAEEDSDMRTIAEHNGCPSPIEFRDRFKCTVVDDGQRSPVRDLPRFGIRQYLEVSRNG